MNNTLYAALRLTGIGLLAVCLLSTATRVSAQYGGPNPVLTKSMSPSRPTVGQVARITITATNAGNANADNVVITDPLPDNLALAAPPATTQGTIGVAWGIITVYVGTIVPGQTVTVTHDVVVLRAFASDTPYTNCAGLTYFNGTARLSCFPLGPAFNPVPITSPPLFLPEAGAPAAALPIGALLLGSICLFAATRLRARR